jgi:uncharacterized protein
VDNQLPEQQPVIQPLNEPKKKNKVLLICGLVIGVLLIGLLAYFFFNTQKAEQVTSVIKDKAQNILSSPTPMPFEELTVPYLRNKEYKSTLGEREVFSQNADYISYVTSYTSDGLRINGLLTVPPGDMPEGGWPAIIFIHGYIPPREYVTTEKYVDYIDYLARNGFVVFKIDLRGHGNSEGEPGGGYYGSDYIIDTLNARAALQTADFVNPNKIGLWGHSMAGNVILRSMAVKPEIPASVIWAGAVYSYVDQRKYGIQDSSFNPSQFDPNRLSRRRMLFEKYGSPSAESPFWSKVAATNYIGDMKGAIQIHHAIDDDVVNIGYSRDLQALLENTNVPHELHEYPDGGHNIIGSSFVTAMDRTVAFFNTYLSK